MQKVLSESERESCGQDAALVLNNKKCLLFYKKHNGCGERDSKGSCNSCFNFLKTGIINKCGKKRVPPKLKPLLIRKIPTKRKKKFSIRATSGIMYNCAILFKLHIANPRRSLVMEQSGEKCVYILELKT